MEWYWIYLIFSAVMFIEVYAILISISIEIKTDMRYKTVKTRTLVQNFVLFISDIIVLAVVCLIPFLNLIVMINSIASFSTMKQKMIDDRLLDGRLIKKA